MVARRVAAASCPPSESPLLYRSKGGSTGKPCRLTARAVRIPTTRKMLIPTGPVEDGEAKTIEESRLTTLEKRLGYIRRRQVEPKIASPVRKPVRRNSRVRQARRVAATVCVAATLCGCAAGPSTNYGERLGKKEPAPPTVPFLSINNVEIAPATYEWMIGGKLQKFRAAADQNNVDLRDILVLGNTLVIILGSSARPSQLVITSFSNLDPTNGAPIDSEGHELDCLHPQDPCRISIGGVSIQMRPTLPDRTKILVVHVAYWDDSPTTADLTLDSASWGVRLIQGGED